MKKALILILALLLIAALCACSTDVKTQTDTSPAQTVQPPQTVMPTNPSPTATSQKKVPVPFTAQYLQIGSSRAEQQYPHTVPIRSREALYDFYDANKSEYNLGAIPDSLITIGFADVANVYDAAFFEQNALVLVMMNEHSTSIAHRVTRVWTMDGLLQIDVDRLLPSVYEACEGLWYIIIEVPQSSLDERDIDVHISDVEFDETDTAWLSPVALASGGRTIDPYEAVITEITYDSEAGGQVVTSYDQDFSTMIDYFPTLTVGDALLENGWLPLRDDITLYDADFDVLDTPDMLTAAMLYQRGAGIYYVGMKRTRNTAYVEKAETYNQKTSMYLTKLIVPESTAGLAGQLASLGGFDWSSVSHAVVVAEANDERDRPPIDLRCQQDATQCLIAMLCTTPAVSVGQPVDAAPARSNVIDVYAGDDVLMTLYHTQDGFFIGTGGVCYAADASPWLFDQLVLAATGRDC